MSVSSAPKTQFARWLQQLLLLGLSASGHLVLACGNAPRDGIGTVADTNQGRGAADSGTTAPVDMEPVDVSAGGAMNRQVDAGNEQGGAAMDLDCSQFDNPMIAASVEAQLGPSSDGYESAALASLGGLNLFGISSFDDLECFVGLVKLDLSNTMLSDYAGVSELELAGLHIIDSQAPDIESFDANSSTLVEALRWFSITTSGPLSLLGISQLQELYELGLNGNNIDDVQPLETLPHLSTLELNKNELATIEAIGALTTLTRLELDENIIESLAPLSGLDILESLTARSNKIAVLAPLELPSLISLDVADNEIKELGELVGLNRLETLNLARNALSSLEGIQNLMALTFLDASETNLQDLTALAALEQLEQLDLHSTQIRDLTPLGALENLIELDITDTPVSNLEPLLVWPSRNLDEPAVLRLDDTMLESVSREFVIPELCAKGWVVYGDVGICAPTTTRP